MVTANKEGPESWLTVAEYLCHKWPRIYYACRNHNPFLISSFVTYHQILTRATRRLLSMEQELLTLSVTWIYTGYFCGVRVTRSLVLCSVLWTIVSNFPLIIAWSVLLYGSDNSSIVSHFPFIIAWSVLLYDSDNSSIVSHFPLIIAWSVLLYDSDNSSNVSVLLSCLFRRLKSKYVLGMLC